MLTPNPIPHTAASRALPGSTLTAALDVATSLYSGWRPGAADLAGAARLDDWSVCRLREEHRPVLVGRIVLPGAGEAAAGTFAISSPIVWLDRASGWARSITRWYVLGDERPVFEGTVDNEDECGRRILEIRRMLVAGGTLGVH